MDSAAQSPSNPIPERQPPNATKPRKGRPRDPEAYEAILEATRRLVREKSSYREISIERIAQSAKVSKATIYRWWGHKANLLREACWTGHLPPIREKSLEEDLACLLLHLVQAQTELMNPVTYAGSVTEMLELQQRPEGEASEVTCPFEEGMKEQIQTAFQRARARGDWRGPFDTDLAYDLMCGTVFSRATVHQRAFSEQDRRAVARAVLAALGPGESQVADLP